MKQVIEYRPPETAFGHLTMERRTKTRAGRADSLAHPIARVPEWGINGREPQVRAAQRLSDVCRAWLFSPHPSCAPGGPICYGSDRALMGPPNEELASHLQQIRYEESPG